ncbi:alpha/beta fold hydrolase [Halobacillus halophilus]|uniref:alpha/beta fold hydrolase n=1 Tax=Halobacillus halophilus TaxID=1570 RepID=UPI001CD75C9F|nr:alpha/beta hydrolase [Halobacillus halophilus]MCA1012414.1 alpha/beta hydrolase [Halobacillus halophilus]
MPYFTEKHGKQLFYEDKGNGEAIIFIHPPGMGRKVFRQQHALAEHFRIIFPDLSGNGDSELVTKAPDITFYAREIKQLVDHLRIDKVSLVGYSCGGMVAQEFALTYPKRVHALILAGGFPKVDTGGLRFEFLVGMEWVRKSPETLAKLLSNSHFRDPDIKQELSEHMAKSSPDAWYEFYNRGFRFDCSRRLPKLEVPLLLMYGTKEFWINHHVKYYFNCPDTTLVYIERAYHQIPATHWPIFNQYIKEFIEKKVSSKKAEI